MDVPERWARTDDRIELLQLARHEGDLCAWCGREIPADETVYVERFRVGTRRIRLHGPIRHRGIALAPVGRECASERLLQLSDRHEPERCASCGRGVVYDRVEPMRKVALCSRRCASRHGKVQRDRRLATSTDNAPAN